MEIGIGITGPPLLVGRAVDLDGNDIVGAAIRNVLGNIEGKRRIAARVGALGHAVDPYLGILHGGLEFNEGLSALIRIVNGKMLTVPTYPDIRGFVFRRDPFGAVRKTYRSPRGVAESARVCPGNISLLIFPSEIKVDVGPVGHRRRISVRHAIINK